MLYHVLDQNYTTFLSFGRAPMSDLKDVQVRRFNRAHKRGDGSFGGGGGE